jgi:hypothetical protein
MSCEFESCRSNREFELLRGLCPERPAGSVGSAIHVEHCETFLNFPQDPGIWAHFSRSPPNKNLKAFVPGYLV